MKKALFFLCVAVFFFNLKEIQAHGFGAHAAHLSSILALNDHYKTIIEHPRYQPYFIYGSIFPDIQYAVSFKSTLQNLYQQIRSVTLRGLSNGWIPDNAAAFDGLTYEISTDQIPDEYPFGIDTHSDKYALAFAEYLLQQCAPINPPGPNPGSNGIDTAYDARNMKIAFALGYYAHLAEDIACHDFMVPRITASLDLGDLELIKNTEQSSFNKDPNAQLEGIIEGIMDHYYGSNNTIADIIYNEIWVGRFQIEPTIMEMDVAKGYAHLFYNGPAPTWYDAENNWPEMNPVLLFFHSVLNTWYNTNPFNLPSVGEESYKKDQTPLSATGLNNLTEVFRFVNRFYPAVAGQPFNGFNRLDEVLGNWVANHLDLSNEAIAWGLTPAVALTGILGLFTTFEFNVSCLSGLAYPNIRDGFTSELSRDSRSMVGLMLSDMAKADELATNYPDRINIESYIKLKNSILFTNPTSLLSPLWVEYKSLGTKIYNEVGPLTPDGTQPGKWYTDWSPWHKQSMAWGVLSSLNNSIPDIYTSNQNVAVYDAYFEVNNARITGPQLPEIFQNNPVVKTKVELYNTSNVPSESITLKVKRDHNSTDYSLDPLKTSTTFSIDHDPLFYNTTDRKKVELTVPSVSLTELVNYRGYYMEAVKNSNNKPMFTSSFEQYQERLDLTPNYSRLYGSYDEGKWPVSLGLVRSVATVNLNTAQFPEGGGSGGTYRINGILQNTITGSVDDYITLEAIPPSGWSFYKWSDNNLNNPRTYRITSTTTNLSAIYKGIKASNSSSAYSLNNQTRFLKTPNGHLHNVYESLNTVWYERSTDNGANWQIMNGGLPLTFNIGALNAKSPSISSSNDSDNPQIYITYQVDNYGGYNEDYVVVSQLFNGNHNWTEIVSDNTIDYNYDTKPIVTGLLGFCLVLYKPASNAAFFIKEYVISTTTNNIISATLRTLPSSCVDGSSVLPAITNGSGKYHLAYQYGASQIRYLRWSVNSNPVSTYNYSIPSTNSGYSLNTEPVISLANYNPVISWKGAQYTGTREAVLRRGSISGSTVTWGDFLKTGSSVNYIHNNSANNSTEKTVMTWSQDGSVTKWIKRTHPVNGATQYSTSANLSHGGINVQVTAGTDYNNMKANIFRYSSPLYFFTQSTTDFSVLQEQGGELNKIAADDTVLTFGRSGILDINGIEFVFNIGDVMVDDSIITFVEKPDTIYYQTSATLNQHTRTKNFTLTPSTNFYFSNIYYVVQKSNPDTALTSADAVNFKAELVNAITNQAVGTFDNVTYNKNNIEKYASIDYQVDCSGITPGDYYLRLLTTINTDAGYALANIVSDNTTLAKKNFNKVNFTGSEIPITYDLEQNFPNPFNPSTTIRYQIPQDGIVTLKIYDILGAEVKTLVNEEKVAGKYEVNFNASSLASGVYIYKIQAGSFISSKKMILLK